MQTLSCEECGDSEHLYIKVDLKWDPLAGQFEVDEIESFAECTSCDSTQTYVPFCVDVTAEVSADA
jgi:hypothetical protein